MFAPILPGSSLASWVFLKDSKDSQMEIFARDPVLERENNHFSSALVNMTSVEDLMNDYQALSVALGAHGLKDDIANRYFLQQVLEQGVSSEGAFANRLSDSRYYALAETFETLGLTGTGDLSETAPDLDPDLAAALNARFGESPLYQSTAARLSGNLTLGLLGADTSEDVWARAVEDDLLQPVLARILGVSDNINGLDTEAQIETLRSATEFLFEGTSLSTLSDPDHAYDIGDAYLGTAGQPLSTAFSYGGLRDAFDTITNDYTTSTVTPSGGETVDEAVDAARWSALQADTALRDVLAGVVGVSAGFSSLSAADQVTELKTATEAYFGRSDFSLFTVQANVIDIGDRHLAPVGTDLSQAFTLGALNDHISMVRDTDVGADARWQAVLSIDSVANSFVQAYGLDAALLDGDQADLIDALKTETLARFGSEDVEAITQDPEKLAAVTGLVMQAQIGDITDNYLDQEFRVAIGELRPELRVALSVAEELEKAVQSGGTDTGQWYRVLGSDVLRAAFETAYGLGTEFAGVDLDLQVSAMKEYSRDLIGSESVGGYLDPEKQEQFIQRYLSQAGTTAVASNASVSLFGEASASTILATIYSG